MKLLNAIALVTFLFLAAACSRQIIPDKPFLGATNFKMDSLPESVINIPIQLDLKPIYRLMEKQVDTVFTSPNWPNDWVEVDCATRYKYHFRRGPLELQASGLRLDLGFTGYYKIIGSTRVCLGNTVISPWTPPCRCGFDEGERRVKVGFSNSVTIRPDYQIKLAVNRKEPEPLDKCQVCLFNLNITDQVMKGMKEELDLASKVMLDSFGTVNLKPQVQELWNVLNTSFNLYGLGWLQINPTQLRLNNVFASRDSLNIHLGLNARPIVRLDKPDDRPFLVPNMAGISTETGFNIFLDAMLNYDSLSLLLNRQMQDKRFDLDEKGKKYMVIRDARIYGGGNEKLVIKLSFTGTKQGVAYLTGRPVFNAATRMIEVREVDFDVKTRDLLLKTAGWLFNRRIINEIGSQAKFDLSQYIDTAMIMMNQQLNSELVKGVRSQGGVNELGIVGFYPLSDRLVVRSRLSGILLLRVESIDFAF